MENQNFISVFKGSTVEADQVHEYFEDNNVGSLVRNHIQENLSAGWMISESDHAAEVFVSAEDFIEAEALLKNMFHEGLTSETFVEQETEDPL